MTLKKITPIFFTFKRAILIDSSLNSLLKNFRNTTEEIYVIYNYNNQHHLSYEKFFKKYKNQNLKVFQRQKKKIYIGNINLFLRPLNYIWFYKWPKIITEFNNFKKILENILKIVKTDFVMFVPDDQIFYKETIVPNLALDMISKNKFQTYYRFFTGDHFEGKYSIPKKMKKQEFTENGIKFFKWSNEDFFAKSLWKYRFTIEGTVFHKDALLKFLKPMVYHNPITLEANGLWESRFRGYFKYGLSSCKRTAAGYQINNVQNLVKNQCATFEPDILKKAYLEDYLLFIDNFDFDEKKLDIVPEKLTLYKEKIENKIDYNKYKINLK